MQRFIATFMSAVLALSGTACATNEVNVRPSGSYLREYVEPGDRVHIYTRDRQDLRLTIVSVGNSGLTGRDSLGEHEIAYTEVLAIEHEVTRYWAPIREVILVLAGVGGAALLIGLFGG